MVVGAFKCKGVIEIINKYEMYVKTPMNLSELLNKFATAGYPGKVKLMKDGLHLTWELNGKELETTVKAKDKYYKMPVYEFCVDNKESFMILHDVIKEKLGLFIYKYEIHVKTIAGIMDIKNYIENAGYRTVMELSEEGVEWHIMGNSNGGYLNVHMELYNQYDGYNEYEFCVDTQKDFMSLHDLMMNL